MKTYCILWYLILVYTVCSGMSVQLLGVIEQFVLKKTPKKQQTSYLELWALLYFISHNMQIIL